MGFWRNLFTSPAQQQHELQQQIRALYDMDQEDKWRQWRIANRQLRENNEMKARVETVMNLGRETNGKRRNHH